MKHFLIELEVAVFMTFFLLVSLIMPIVATDVLGVKEGDWAVYKVESYWLSQIPGDKVPPYINDINHTEWRLLVETALDNQSVRLSVTINYNNGTKKIEIYEGNVKAGSGNLSAALMWVVRRNLKVGDLVYEEKTLTVNATESHAFAGAIRSTVHAEFTQQEAGGMYGTYTMLWDKETGILCREYIGIQREVDYGIYSMTTIGLNIVETSLWEPSADNFWFLGLIVIIIVFVLAVVVFVQKRRKMKKGRVRKR